MRNQIRVCPAQYTDSWIRLSHRRPGGEKANQRGVAILQIESLIPG